MIVPIAIVVVLIALYFGVNAMGKSALQEQLLRDWGRYDDSNDVMIELELDFSEDTIEYNFYSSMLSDQIAELSYKVISKNKILVDGREITITFNDDKSMMTMTPAITSSSSSEYWFNH